MAMEASQSVYVDAYMAKKGPAVAKMHPSWSCFDTESKRGSEAKHREFSETIQEYARRDGIPFDPARCTWKEVIQCLEQAQKAATASESGDKHFFSKRRRKAVQLLHLVEPGLDAIPDTFAPLHGGLAVVFHIAQSREQCRKDILDAFEDIPEIIVTAYTQSKNFPGHKTLHDYIDQLKDTLFDTIPRLIEILRPGKLWSKLTFAFRSLQAVDLIHLIHRRAEKVSTCARRLQESLAVEAYRTAESNQTTSLRVLERVDEVHGTVSSVGQGVTQLHGQFGTIDARMMSLEGVVSQHIDYAMSSQVGLVEMLGHIVSMFQLHTENGNAQQNSPQSPAVPFAAASAEQCEAFLRLLFTSDIEMRDLQNVLRRSHENEFDPEFKSYGAMILGSRRFQSWLAAAGQDLVYVEGPPISARSGRASPMSYFCATLVRYFDGSDSIATLHFFCGQHAAITGGMQGPRALVRSLLSQLLRLWPAQAGLGVPVDVVDIPAGFEGTHADIPMDELCRRFESAVRCFTEKQSIICVIDGWSEFERDYWELDYWQIFDTLERILFDQASVRFRVVMTSTSRSRGLEHRVARGNRIVVTERGRNMGQKRQDAAWDSIRFGGRRH